MRLSLLAIMTFFYSYLSVADDRENLMLRGYVLPSIKTKILQTQLSASKSLVTFSSHINSRFVREGQKFEVEGLDQVGLESQIKLIAGGERTIQYELLINRLKTSVPSTGKPIFLKISAN